MPDPRHPMRHLTLRFALATAVASAALGAQAAEPGATIVEFVNPAWNKYFISANPADWALLDQYASVGWRRTGVTFSAFTQGQDARAKPVYRFFAPAVGSHFFTISDSDRALLLRTPGFVDEGIAWYALDTVQTFAATENPCSGDSTALYRTFNNGSNGPANHRYFEDYTFYRSYATKGYALEGAVMCLPMSTAEKRADASRLLHQATFGARTGDIDAVLGRGINGWFNDQFTAPTSQYTPQDYWPVARPDDCINNTSAPLTATSYCQRDNYSLFQPQRQFFAQALTGPDQLRQRMAWTWSQLFVISGTSVGQAYGMLDYQQMLRDNAFANFRTLMERVTLHPAMGRFLNMANNQKPNATTGVQPNENYARELMQLFTLGLFQLNLDGSVKRDGSGTPLPTYGQDDVRALARVFTGWTYPTVAGVTPATQNRTNLKGVMEERASTHDFSAQTLLGATVAGTLTQSQQLSTALDIVFNHPNVAPFVSRFLIQHLVTGDPSPGYVERVARVFQNNGSGVRGDTQAVIRAILTDVEARGAAKWAPDYGHQAEPVLLVTRLARAMSAQSDGVYFRNTTGGAGQTVFTAPSVFNYYSPDYELAGSGINAPEFTIYNTASALSRVNAAYGIVFGSVTPDPTVFGATGTQFDLSIWTAVAGDSNALLDRVNELLFAGRLGAASRAAMKGAIDAVSAADVVGRARTALYLAAVAPENQVLR